MTDRHAADPGFECVESELGAQIWQIDREDADPHLKVLLRDHLAVCDACRLTQAVMQRLPEAFAAPAEHGAETRPPLRILPGRDRLRRRTGAWGGLALAAGLVLVTVLPPSPAGDDRLLRGDGDAPCFLRPVEGEVVTDGRSALSWHAIEGASGYRVRLESADGAYSWEQTVRGATTAMPDRPAPPPGTELRAFLEPVPADLAPPGGISVAFRTGDGLDVARYRFDAAPLAARLLVGFGLASLLCSLSLRVLRRAR
ncbi:MAG: hypothetical protein C0418_05620 [Coriobacteriaceae bacterium]|nr:hypothetical protein [Coriobacteriaceae bacterium]